jgi:hypothetical protein
MPIADDAKEVYQALKARLEADHLDDFVAIEPKSKSHFIGKTSIEAAMAAKEAFPDRKSFLIRIGHEAAFHIGTSTQ